MGHRRRRDGLLMRFVRAWVTVGLGMHRRLRDLRAIRPRLGVRAPTSSRFPLRRRRYLCVAVGCGVVIEKDGRATPVLGMLPPSGCPWETRVQQRRKFAHVSASCAVAWLALP